VHSGIASGPPGPVVCLPSVTRLLDAMEVAHADGAIQRFRTQLPNIQAFNLDDFGLAGMTAQSRADLL